MPYNAISVANYLLETARRQGAGIDPLKLIKLVYIAHGWCLVMLGRPLVSDQIQAWQYGPVIPSLYQAVRDYRYQPVPILPTHPFQVREEIDPDSARLLDAVYETYGRFSGGQLSNMTHQEGTPWDTAWKKQGQNSRINDELIAEHYRELRQRRTVQS